MRRIIPPYRLRDVPKPELGNQEKADHRIIRIADENDISFRKPLAPWRSHRSKTYSK
jgi:hypothetical protein